MKKPISILYFILLISHFSFSQVTGVVYLADQFQHQGISVKFIAQSPTALSDSTFTNEEGLYQINLKAGVYLISFSKDSSYTDYYHFSNKILINKQANLDTLILTGKKKYLTGNINGVLKHDIRYYVTANIEINNSDSLHIEPGTVIQFLGKYAFNIYGTLIAEGTSNRLIHFTSGYQNKKKGDWEGIVIKNESKKSNIMYCKIEFANTAISTEGINSNIQFNTIANINKAIFSYKNSPKIEHNRLYNFSEGGIDIAYATSAIACNIIYDGTGFGIRAKRAGNIVNNYIYRLKSDKSFGIFVSDLDSSIANNLIVDCGIAFYLDNNTVNQKNSIFNNTIVRSTIGVKVLTWGNQQISNNIFYDTKTILKYSILHASETNYFENNILYKFKSITDSIPIVGLGILINTNTNGDSSDAYNNIYDYPNFSNLLTYTIDSSINTLISNKLSKHIGFNANTTCLENINEFINSDTLSISGKVHYNDNQTLSTTIYLLNLSTNKTYSVASDASGHFKITSLASGNYILKAVPNIQSNYHITFYPNLLDSTSSPLLTLGGSITEIDLYLIKHSSLTTPAILTAITIFPNPFMDELHIYKPTQMNGNDLSITKITIFNQLSEIVYGNDIQCQHNNFAINLSFLKSGLYFIQIETNLGVITKKITKT